MKRSFGKTFSRLLVSYLVTMVVTVSICIYTYYAAIRVVERDAADSNLSMLRQSSEVISAHLKDVENVVAQIGFNPIVLSFLSNNSFNELTDYYKAIETWNYLQTYRFTSDFIDNFYVIFKNSSIIMSPKNISLRVPMFYERSIHYNGLSYDQWMAEFTEKYHNGEYLPASKIEIDGKNESYLTYIQTLPYDLRSNFKGAMFVLIPESQLLKLLFQGNLPQGGWSYIADANGNILTSVTWDYRKVETVSSLPSGPEGYRQLDMNGERMLVSYYTSPTNRWQYVSAIPVEVVMAKADSIKRTNTFIIIAGLLAGLLFAVFFANRHSKPIRTLVHRLETTFSLDNEHASNEYRLLDHSISRLIRSNEALQSEIEQQAPLLRAAVLDALFRGEFSDAEELAAALADVGLPIRGVWFAVLVLQAERHEERLPGENADRENVRRVVMKDLLYQELRESGYVHDLRRGRIAILLNFSFPDKTTCELTAEQIAAGIQERFRQQANLPVLIGVGGWYDSGLDVYRSFQEAVKALEWFDAESGETILRYEQMAVSDSGYHYPPEIEQRIVNLAKSGNREELARLLQDIRAETAGRGSGSPAMLQLLVGDLSATVYRLIHETVAPGKSGEAHKYRHFVERVQSYASFQEAYAFIGATLLDLCEYANSQKKSHNVALKDNIIGYLQQHYSDGGLSLSSVADRFGISEVYLSQFFKEQTGENFSAYMENIRMNAARELLLSDQLTVDDVAKQVGYLNTNTFYKAFKRVEGISPGKFRSR
ncbi:helix-turn-helix domain-containing protein [Paenibacillus cymbidii]|uniref:helix-turn-helix domain-containing protein n=1 Tax=Paenibacillus cymbidii TaxID=1639034 RepID=UPI0010821A45|nr:helix-turn-helix domain-containing protein [Paenibacillus cymbidii]